MITGLRALECGYEEVREELFQTMKSLTEVFDFFYNFIQKELITILIQ